MTEYLELDPARKWQYLQRYYEVASRFYESQENIVTDEEIQECIQRFKERPSPKYRQQILLKNWKFQMDPDDVGIKNEFFTPGYDDSRWETITTPHSAHYIPSNPDRFGRLDCNLIKTEALWQAAYDAWYRTGLVLDTLGEDQTAYLSFESVNHISTVWVNDNPVMLDHVGLFPYKIDIGDELHRRKSNPVNIAVRARNIVSNHPNLFYNGWQFAYRNPPYTSGDQSEDWVDQADAGIAGEAVLTVLNHNHLENVFIFTEKIEPEAAALTCQVTLRNASRERFEGSIWIELSRWLPAESGVIQVLTTAAQTLPMNESRADIRFSMISPDLWDLDSPNLYLAHIILKDSAGRPLDDLYESFGVRTFRMEGSSFYLNNRRFVPRGTHDVAVYPGESEIAPSDTIIVKDILLHKKMGATCSRWPSDKSIQYRRLVDYCDQLGFMLSWCGYMMIWTLPPELEMLAQRDVKNVVRALRNCPSILIWEMGDEPFMWEHDYRRMRWYQWVYDLVRAEDHTRPILPAGDYCRDLLEIINSRKRPETDLDAVRREVLCDFPLFDLECAAWDYHLVPHGKPVLAALDEIRDAFAGHKPTVLTEFGAYGMPEFEKVKDIYGQFRWAPNPLSGQIIEKYNRDFYGRQVGAQDWKESQACQATIVSGMIGRMRSNPEAFAAYYQVSMFDAWTFYWGLVNAHGDPKLAYWVVQSCYAPLYVSGLYGNTLLKAGQTIAVQVSNYLEEIENAFLQIRILDQANQVLRQESFLIHTIPGKMASTEIAQITIPKFEPGLYAIEYVLESAAQALRAKTIELFFLEE